MKIRPMPLWQSILLFGTPGLFLYLGLYYSIPFFQQMGYSKAALFAFFLWLPLLPLLPLSIILFKREQKNQPDLDFKQRFRLKRLTKNHWLWILGGMIATFLLDNVIMEPFSKWMAAISIFAPPEHFPALLNPLKDVQLPLNEFMGVSLAGNWLFLIIIAVFYPTAQIAEEFMWRGYILPRQEKTYGNKAWLVNGLLWAFLLHAFMKWNFIAFLPGMLITPFIAQKTKNTWVSLLVHGVPNALMLIVFILAGILNT